MFRPLLTCISAANYNPSNRTYATLKSIQIRLKSVKNIQKITQSMKMVSAAKYAKAERDLKMARPYGLGAIQFYDKVELKPLDDSPQKLLIAVTSDRGFNYFSISLPFFAKTNSFLIFKYFVAGLCGAVHTNVSKMIRNELAINNENVKVVCVGDKSRAILQRLYGKNLMLVATEIGRKPPTFLDAAKLANAIFDSGYNFSSGKIIYNRFKSVVAYETKEIPLFNLDSITVTLF